MDDLTASRAFDSETCFPELSMPGAPGFACNACPARFGCAAAGIAAANPGVFPLTACRRLRAGQHLFRAGEPFAFCYAVRSGTLKSAVPLSDGRDQVTGFHLSGEVVGSDGMATGAHASTVLALEDSTVCAFSAELLADAAAAAHEVRERLWGLIAGEVLREHEMIALLATTRIEQRVAAFLIEMGERLAARGFSGNEYYLRMSRADIGSYLGTSVETVSRTLSGLAQDGIVAVQRRHIRILDRERLTAEAGNFPLLAPRRARPRAQSAMPRN